MEAPNAVVPDSEDGVAAVPKKKHVSAHINCPICRGRREVMMDPVSGEKVCGGCLNPFYFSIAGTH